MHTKVIFSLLFFSSFFSQNLISDLVKVVNSEYKVIAFGENHQHEEFHSLIKLVLADTIVRNSIDVIVVEFANSLYQNILDRFILGEVVDKDSLKLLWRNTLVSPNTVWDSNLYEKFFYFIRNLNLNSSKKYRVVAGGAKIDWSLIQSRKDLSDYYKKSRSHYLFDAIKKSVYGGKKRAILIAGNVHSSKSSARYKSRHGYFYSDVSFGSLMDLYYPNSLYTIASIVSENKELKTKFKVKTLYKIAELSNFNIEANAITKLRNYNGKKFDGFGTKVLSDMADAVIYWGSKEQNTFIEENKKIYKEDSYWEELNRRSLILRKQKMNPELRT